MSAIETRKVFGNRVCYTVPMKLVFSRGALLGSSLTRFLYITAHNASVRNEVWTNWIQSFSWSAKWDKLVPSNIFSEEFVDALEREFINQIEARSQAEQANPAGVNMGRYLLDLPRVSDEVLRTLFKPVFDAQVAVVVERKRKEREKLKEQEKNRQEERKEREKQNRVREREHMEQRALSCISVLREMGYEVSRKEQPSKTLSNKKSSK